MAEGREPPDMSQLTEREAMWVAADAFERMLDVIPTVRRPQRTVEEIAEELYLGTMQERALARAREAAKE